MSGKKLINGDGVAYSPYKWVFEEMRQQRFFSEDGEHEVTIEYRKKASMLPEDYKRAWQKGFLGKKEYEKCLKRPLWKSKGLQND